MQQPPPERDYPEDVHFLTLPGPEGPRTLILVGTAHISKDSVALVRRVIEAERPDRVCVELDDKRFQALSDRHRFKSLDLKAIIRNKQLSILLVNMVMASYQKKLGGQLGVLPGAELLEATRVAAEKHIPVELCDRDVRVTLRRAWHHTSLFKKNYLLAVLLASLFDRTELDEEKLAALKKKDMLSELLAELGEVLPDLKRVLIDERDIYMAERIKATPGHTLVAVVGAGHVAGLRRHILTDQSGLMAEIGALPPASRLWRILGWGIPLLIVASLAAIGWRHGSQAAGANIVYWILANGIPSAIGAALALAHPLTIAGAFAAAPVTSLTPVIGAGYVTAFIQVMVRPPVVAEFEAAAEDMLTFTGWWRNKLLRVFLAFLLPGLGSMIGTWIGGVEIVKNLF
jgi:pheromone shutdown-related protein TraB